MKHCRIKRRSFIGSGILGATLSAIPGSILAGPHKDLQSKIMDIVLRHFPKAASQPEVVEAFAQLMIKEQGFAKEEQGFIQQAARKLDDFELERFVMIQFSTKTDHQKFLK